MRRPAFTLTELLVVIGVTAVLAAAAVPSYAAFRNALALRTSTDELVSTLRTTQNRALSSQDGRQWMVHCTATGYSVVSRDETSGATTILSTTELESGVTIQGAPFDVVFNRLTGTTTARDVILDYHGRPMTVAINRSGTITSQ